jgi:methyl-accepting chemotaxis protein
MLINLRIGTRLAIGFGGLITCTVLAFAAAVWFGMQGQAATAEIARGAQARVALVVAMQTQQLKAVSSIRSAGLQTDSADANRDIEGYRAAMKQLITDEEKFAAATLSAQEQATLARARTLREQAAGLAEEAVKFAATFASEEVAKVLSEHYAPVQEKWGAELSRLVALEEQRSAAEALAIAANGRHTALMLSALLAVATLAAAGFAIALTRSVTRPLQIATSAAERVAGGDLSVAIEIQGKDEVAELLGSLAMMSMQLSAMVQDVRQSADSINVASDELSTGNVDLSERTERQAGSLQQTALAVSALNLAVAQNERDSVAAREVAERTAGIAAQGGACMHDVAQTMQGISSSSKRIGEIIGVIDGIAFQTNILALNAAVEAARAGEQGRGFAVVATEVRALAQRVTTASREVRQLIADSTARVDAGARLVDNLGGTMQELIIGVDQVQSLMGAISAASAAQGQGIVRVTGSMQDIDGSTQANAAMVEQMTASTLSLTAQTQRLSEVLARFRLEGEPEAAPVAAESFML